MKVRMIVVWAGFLSVISITQANQGFAQSRNRGQCFPRNAWSAGTEFLWKEPDPVSEVGPEKRFYKLISLNDSHGRMVADQRLTMSQVSLGRGHVQLQPGMLPAMGSDECAKGFCQGTLVSFELLKEYGVYEHHVGVVQMVYSNGEAAAVKVRWEDGGIAIYSAADEALNIQQDLRADGHECWNRNAMHVEMIQSGKVTELSGKRLAAPHREQVLRITYGSDTLYIGKQPR